MDDQIRIGFIGIGNMGNPMASRLSQAGFNLTVFDVKQDCIQALKEKCKVNAASSIRDLGKKCNIVITMLPNGEIVRKVVLGRNGQNDCLLGSMEKGSILIDMSSSSPVGTRSLSEILSKNGISMLDAPVSGGVPRAKIGDLSIMVGGNSKEIDKCRPLFNAMASKIFKTGPLGTGHAMKVLNNLVSAAGLIAAAEAVLVGIRFGLDTEVMIDILNASTGRNNSTEKKFKQFILSRTFNSGFSLEHMVKDLTIAMELARETLTPVPLSVICRELWTLGKVSQKTEADHTEIVRWYEEMIKTEII